MGAGASMIRCEKISGETKFVVSEVGRGRFGRLLIQHTSDRRVEMGLPVARHGW